MVYILALGWHTKAWLHEYEMVGLVHPPYELEVGGTM